MTAPVFILVLSGIMYFGALFATIHSLQQLTAEAARASIPGLSHVERSRLAQDFVSRNAGAYPLIDGDKLAVTASPSAADVNVFEVVVSYDASDLPVFAMADLLPLPSGRMERRAVIRRGGY